MSDMKEMLARLCATNRLHFGRHERTTGLVRHVRLELSEIAACDTAGERAEEWIDIVILGLDGLLRAVRADLINNHIVGHDPHNDNIAARAHARLLAKIRKNELRDFGAIDEQDDNSPILHKRGIHD